MEQKLKDFLVKEFKIGKLALAPLDILLLAGTTAAGILMRTSVMMPSDLGILTLVFDVLLAILCAVFIFTLTRHKIKTFLTYAVVIMLPVLVAGSAMWGLGDSVYVFFAVLALYLTVTGYGSIGLFFFGLAVFWNYNALFLLPVFLVCFWKGMNKLWGFIFPIIGYGAKPYLLPEIVEKELLSYNYPNVYQLFGPDKFVSEYGSAAVWLAAGICVILCVLFLMRGGQPSGSRLIALGLMFAVLIPYFAPFMNERSGLMADVLAVLFGFIYLKKFYVPIIQVTVSYMAYSVFFRGESVVPLPLMAFVSLGLLLVISLHVFKPDEKGIKL